MKMNLKNFITIYITVSSTMLIFLSVSRNSVNTFRIVPRLRYRFAKPPPKGIQARKDRRATPILITLLLLFFR